MGRDRPELRGQHGDPVEHVLLWAYSCVPHAGNGHIPLKGIVLLGLGAAFKFYKGPVGFLLKVHFGKDLLHVTGIAESLFRTFSPYYSLELFIGDIEEPCKGLFHNRVRQGAVQLDVSPFVSQGAKDVLTEEASINGPEGFLLIGIGGF